VVTRLGDGAGQAVATDIIEAAGIAYVRALSAAQRREHMAAAELAVGGRDSLP